MVLLIVDTQNIIMNEDLYDRESLIKNIKNLLSAARSNNIEVIYVRHHDDEIIMGTKEFDIYEEFAPMPNEKVFDKTVNSAFCESGLLEYLQAKNETDVMIAGLQTDYCIDATVKAGFEHGFKMIVPQDCNTTVDNPFMTAKNTCLYYNQMMWNMRYASCIELDEAISELLLPVKNLT